MELDLPFREFGMIGVSEYALNCISDLAFLLD
jgi:hypothetical protein